MNTDLDKKVDALAKKKLADLLSIIDDKAVVNVVKGTVYIGGEAISESRLANLHSEAEFLVASDIWKILTETMKAEAQRVMFVSSESLVDLQKGKTILFTLQSQQNIVGFFKKLSPTK